MWGCTGAVAASEGLFFSASLCLTLLLSAWAGGVQSSVLLGSVNTALFGGVSSSPQPELLNSKPKLVSAERRFQDSPVSICGDLQTRQSSFPASGVLAPEPSLRLVLLDVLISDHYPPNFQSYASHRPRENRHQNLG
nr:uncharacterized protein LOC115934949 [Gorilla gorilla gorilla]